PPSLEGVAGDPMWECALVQVKIRIRLAQGEMHGDLIVGIKRGARLQEPLKCQEPRVACRGKRFEAGEVEKDRGFSRRQRDRLLISPVGILKAAKDVMGGPNIVVHLGLCRRREERLLIVRDRLFVAIKRQQYVAEIAVSLGIIWLDLKRAPVMR